MAFTVEVTLFEQPTIAALRIGEDFPTIVVHIPEEKAIGAVLQDRLADLVQSPLTLLFYNRLVGRIDFFLRFHIEAVMVEHRHLLVVTIFLFDYRYCVGTTEPNKDGDRAGTNDLEPEKFGVKLTGLIKIL